MHPPIFQVFQKPLKNNQELSVSDLFHKEVFPGFGRTCKKMPSPNSFEWFILNVCFYSKERKSTLINSLSLSPEIVIYRCPAEQVFLITSQISRENTCVRELFLIKLQAFRSEKRLQHGYCSVKLAKFVRSTFLQKSSTGCLWVSGVIFVQKTKLAK